jgi:hypothetical protein
MNDMEVRWIKSKDGHMKLQYRIKTGDSFRDWSEWRDVPTVGEES